MKDSTVCSKCNLKYGSYNEKGNLVRVGNRGMCKRCYVKEHKASKVCKECGNEMLTGSITGLCPVCRVDTYSQRTKDRMVKPPDLLDDFDYEIIRRLLVRFKMNLSTFVDTFRVIDAYMIASNNSTILDNLSEESQLNEMLKFLKTSFEYNTELRKDPKYKPPKRKITDNMSEYRKWWYLNSPKSYRNKCIKKWK